MEEMGNDQTFPFTFEPPVNGPSSPPVTPGSRTQPPFPPFANQPSPIAHRNGVAALADSPPMDFEPQHKVPPLRFARPQPREPFSRHSTASPAADSATPRGSSPEVDSGSDSEPEQQPVRTVVVEEGDFTVEEVLGSDYEGDRHLVVVRPDQIEDMLSDQEGGDSLAEGVARKFRNLTCTTDVDTDEELERWKAEKNRKKRWSAGLFKRSHSKSEDGGSECDSDRPVAKTAGTHVLNNGRQRRRLTRPSERSSPILNGIKGKFVLEEPDEVVLDDDTDESLVQLPFFQVQDPMDIDADDSQSSP